MTEIAERRPRGTRRRRILIVLIAAILLLLLARTGLDWWAGHKIDAQVTRLEQRYGSLDASTLSLPPVPEGENRARAIRAAAALINYTPLASWSEYQHSYSAFLKQQPPVSMPAHLRAFVETNRPTLRVALDARSRPQSNWEADYGSQSNVPRLLDIRTLSNTIYLAALLDLEAGRPDEAARSIASGLAMAASLRQEPWLVTQLIRVAVSLQQFEAVQRLLMQSEPSKASLEELAKWLTENQTPDPMTIGLLSEMKHFNAVLARSDGVGPLSKPDEQFAIFGRFTWFARPLTRSLRARYLEQLGHLLDVQTGPRPRPAPSAVPRMSFLKRLDTMVGMSGLQRTMDSGDLFNSALGAAELAVALRRFRLDQGQYPDGLSALVPAYLPKLPIDSFTGQPPVYARQGKGFRLHAENAKNFGAVSAAALDWTVPK